MAPVGGSLPITWETQTEFPAPGFGPAQPQLWPSHGESTSKTELSVNIPISQINILEVYQIHHLKNKNNFQCL